MHGIGIDTVHDEYIVTNPFADTILFFRGGANEDEAPLRLIQGPNTKIIMPDSVAVDPMHNEIFVADGAYRYLDKRDEAEQKELGFIGVWNDTDQGDVPPMSIIKGSNSMLLRPRGVAMNPQDGEIYVVDVNRNALFAFSLPEVFEIK